MSDPTRKHVVFLGMGDRGTPPKSLAVTGPRDAAALLAAIEAGTLAYCGRCRKPKITERERSGANRAGLKLERCCCLVGGAAYLSGHVDSFAFTQLSPRRPRE